MCIFVSYLKWQEGEKRNKHKTAIMVRGVENRLRGRKKEDYIEHPSLNLWVAEATFLENPALFLGKNLELFFLRKLLSLPLFEILIKRLQKEL